MIKGSCLCGGVRFEIAAGVLDDGPQIRPERHIMCRREVAVGSDSLTQLDRAALTRHRGATA
mgnify:CR=1 FL=1